jgi:uncharacterized protein (DUF1501 family)
MSTTRRDFMRISCCAAAAMGVTASFERFGLLSALAQSVTDYKALVCIFLFGGNDGNNLIVPTTTTDYNNYATVRGGLALAQSSLLGLTERTGQMRYGLHANLVELQTLFNNQKLGVVANVGNLFQPLSRSDYLNNTKPHPANLFSHSDQQQQWQTSIPSGFGTTGWGGRIADNVGSFNVGVSFPPILSVAGTTIFSIGNQVGPFAMSPGSAPGLQGFPNPPDNDPRYVATQQLLTFDTGISLVQAASNITAQAISNSKTLATALNGLPMLQTLFPATSLGSQLKQVAQVIQARSALGLKRQVFFCSLGGFDTHSNQIADQGNLFGQLSLAMKAFYDATVELGVGSNVTTFTLSDFGRTFQQASGGGSDHGWGNNQLVLGGAVVGAAIYGMFPTFALGGPDDAGSNGRWIPTTSIDQFGATLASWFGVNSTDLPAIFTNLANFPTKNLGFLG